jgi:hypothetical protein
MQRRWRDDVTAVAPQVDALLKPGAIGDDAAWMREIKMPAAAANLRFHGVGQLFEALFQFLKRVVTAVLGIDVEYARIAGSGYRSAFRPQPCLPCDVQNI